MDKGDVVKELALRLGEAEAAIDRALIGNGRLIESLLQARASLRVSALVGVETGERLTAAATALARARAETVAAHATLAEAQAQLGLRHLDLSVDLMGPLDKPPPPSGRVAAPAAVGTGRVLPLRPA